MDMQLINSFLILSIIVAVLFIISNYLKKNNKKALSNLSNFEGKVINRIPLMKNTFLYIVQVGSRTFLLGVTDKSISLVSELKPDESTNLAEFPNPSYQNQPFKPKTIEEINQTQQNDLSFRAFLKSAFSKNN